MSRDEGRTQGAAVEAAGSRLARWRRALREKGIRRIAAERLRRFSPRSLRLRWLGRYVELTGNRVVIQGLTFSVDNPLIYTRQKAMMYDGIHETEEVRYLDGHFDPSLATVELGGSIGVVACLANRRLERPTEHVVVEANPEILPTLEQNRALNNARFEILGKALGHGGGTIDFHVGGSFLGGSTLTTGTGRVCSVPTVSLKTIIDERGFGAINLIVDIEGAEIDLVAHELDVLKRHVKHLILETHDRYLPAGATAKMLDDLAAAGFEVEASGRSGAPVFALINRGLAGGA